MLTGAVSVLQVRNELCLSKEHCERSENGVIITKNYFNVFSCEDEQENGANISSWNYWVTGKVGMKEGAVMGERFKFRHEYVAFDLPEGGDV